MDHSTLWLTGYWTAQAIVKVIGQLKMHVNKYIFCNGFIHLNGSLDNLKKSHEVSALNVDSFWAKLGLKSDWDDNFADNFSTSHFPKSMCRASQKECSIRRGKSFTQVSSILLRFQEKYSCSEKTEVSLVVLHIINLHSSIYWLDISSQCLCFTLENWNIHKFASLSC